MILGILERPAHRNPNTDNQRKSSQNLLKQFDGFKGLQSQRSKRLTPHAIGVEKLTISKEARNFRNSGYIPSIL